MATSSDEAARPVPVRGVLPVDRCRSIPSRRPLRGCGEAEPPVVKPGEWVSNTDQRRDKLTREQLDALRELGMDRG
ncbi:MULTISPECIES: hypothetical protein [unclassified Streptomyces]|uniref:hypothetical protein n=1 Tax=unclassified Streptomyces TaxID=2593676 RepID=UPI0035D9730F